MKDTFEYCLRNGVLGVGFQLKSTHSPEGWDQYLKEAVELHDSLQVPKYIKKWVTKGDLVWTRDTQGMYYLAKVISGWEYWMSPEAMKKDIDIANIFRVSFQPVDIDAVLGKIVACFRAPRSIQEIQSRTAAEYSKYLWNTLTGTNDYIIDEKFASDVFEMMDDEETEDLVFMYLQAKGWYIVPNSRKKDTMGYEFLAVDPVTGERAISQVKTGGAALSRDDYSTYKEKVFLFQSNEIYSGSEYPNVVCLERAALLGFMKASRKWLPATLQKKLNLFESIAGGE